MCDYAKKRKNIQELRRRSVLYQRKYNDFIKRKGNGENEK